eukprot:XP_014783641.1 PREDICTED: enolase-phosphatase E1-like [Octopus bimaculoides]
MEQLARKINVQVPEYSTYMHTIRSTHRECYASLGDSNESETCLKLLHDILFPYVADNLQNYLETHFDDDGCLCDIESLRQLAKQDEESKVIGATRISNTDADKDVIIQDVVANVKWQMSLNRKTTALKQLQGHIWKEAYKLGEIKGELFSDVVPVLHQLKEMGMKLYIYSSGSIESQKLLFSHIPEGNIIDVAHRRRSPREYQTIILHIGIEIKLTPRPK